MRKGETKQEYAMRRSGLLIKSDIPDKYFIELKKYIDNLSEDELDNYIQLAEKAYDRRTLGAKSYKITINALKLCLKMDVEGYKTFPLIEKIATRGWDTSGGTYAFSIPSLKSGMLGGGYYSFGPIASLIKSDAKLDIGLNDNNHCIEIDFK